MNGFLQRLKQRKLVQWALAYIAFVFALIQVLDVVAGSYDWPHSAMHIVFGLLVLGFVVMLVLAWYHGEKGRQRTSGAELLLITLVLAVGGGLLWRFGRGGAQSVVVAKTSTVAGVAAQNATVKAAPAAVFNPPKDSLVVLPFANLSGDPKQRYFSDGITEELTDALGQNPALRVIAWDTASTFRDPKLTATDIGKQLNVANLLHGSIARDGDEVRVTAELVNATTGYQLWSAHYDESFKDIFKVQDAVSKSIADALQVKFAQADLPSSGATNPQAHELVLKGRALYGKLDPASQQAARKDFEQAIALDPDYADAHALLSHTLNRLTGASDLSLKDTLPQIRAEAEKAVALDPRSSDAWVSLGITDTDADPPQTAKARAEYRKALALDPNNADAHMDYGLVLPLKEGLAEVQKAAQLDPGSEFAQNNLAAEYPDVGDWAQSMAAAKAAIRLNPEDLSNAFFLAYAYQQLHQYDKMVAAFDLVKPTTPLDQQQVDTGRLVYRAVANPVLRPQAVAALVGLSRHQSNLDVANNLLVMYASFGEHAALLQLLEGLCPANPQLCYDLAVNPWYAALRGDPRFEKLSKRYTTMTAE